MVQVRFAILAILLLVVSLLIITGCGDSSGESGMLGDCGCEDCDACGGSDECKKDGDCDSNEYCNSQGICIKNGDDDNSTG